MTLAFTLCPMAWWIDIVRDREPPLMIEPIMYLAIGFLLSMLFGLMIVPLVHNRAVS